MKKLLTALLAAALAIACAVPALAAWTGDVYSAWSEYYIRDARDDYRILPDNMMNGYYTQPITRQDFCELAYKTMGNMKGTIEYNAALQEAHDTGAPFDVTAGPKNDYPTAPAQSTPFIDTDSKAVAILSGLGIILGEGNGRFAPLDLLTRQEAATILGRMADYFSMQTFDPGLVYADAGKISGWAAAGVAQVSGMGIMNGTGGGMFSPQGTFTKEQAIATMIREIGCIPYLGSRTEVAPGKFEVFNNFWIWLEDGSGNVLFKLPRFWVTYNYRTDSGYSGMTVFEHGGALLAAAYGVSSDPKSLTFGKNGTTFFDLGTGKERFFIPASGGTFYALTKDLGAVIMQDYRFSGPSVDAAYTVYAVYDFTGKELIAPGSDWSALYKAGYVDTENSFNYTWK